MKTALLLVSIAASAALAPTPNSAAAQGLMRLTPRAQHGAGAARTLAPVFDESEWRERLTSPDLDARMFSYNQLCGLAERDDAVRRQIETWSQDANSPELAWTARLLLREIDFGGRAPTLSGRGLWRIDPFGDDPFGALQQRLDSWMAPGPRGMFPGFGASPNGASTSRSHSVEISPDGVKVRVTENVDGKETTKEYTAKSLDELLEAHPELGDQIGAGGELDGGSSLGDGLQFFFGGRPFQAPNPSGEPSPAPSDVRTDILGVALESLTADERSSLGLESDVGLRIVRVESGTIAERLGLQRGQVLVELNGAAIRSRDDVTAQIRKRATDAEVRAAVVDRWGQRHEASWRPSGARSI